MQGGREQIERACQLLFTPLTDKIFKSQIFLQFVNSGTNIKKKKIKVNEIMFKYKDNSKNKRVFIFYLHKGWYIRDSFKKKMLKWMKGFS